MITCTAEEREKGLLLPQTQNKHGFQEITQGLITLGKTTQW